MALYQTLSDKLRKLGIIDFMLIKWAYLVLGILILTVYPPLYYLSIWYYLIFSILAALPLIMFIIGFNGNLKEKIKQYLANNTPSNQILTLISYFNFGIAIAMFFPILTGFRWYLYLIVIMCLVLKPLSKVLPNK